MRIDPHIVELEEGVWLTSGDGDPPRTLVRKSAALFKSKNLARLALNLARHYRPFKNARIMPAFSEDSINGGSDGKGLQPDESGRLHPPASSPSATATQSPGARMTHTPGPWNLCRHLQSAENDAACGCGYRGGIYGNDGGMVCEIGSTVVPGEEGLEAPRYDRPTELANASLIAAAPDLLALLIRFVAWSEARDAHVARGYVLHDEHQRVVFGLDQERCRILIEAKALLSREGS